MGRWLATLLLVAALCATGCQSLYTSIEPQDDGSYLLTGFKQGFFRLYGILERCTPEGEALRCQEIDRE